MLEESEGDYEKEIKNLFDGNSLHDIGYANGSTSVGI